MVTILTIMANYMIKFIISGGQTGVDQAALDAAIDNTLILDRISHNNIETLNIAGPRESNCPGVYATVLNILKNILQIAQKAW